jgi:hypothetical protein
MARVVEVDGVDASRLQGLGKVYEDGSCVARVLKPDCPQKDLVDMQCAVQIELDPSAVLEHPEADCVLALQELFVRVDPHIEVIKQQVVVGAIGSIRAAQNVSVRLPPRTSPQRAS